MNFLEISCKGHPARVSAVARLAYAGVEHRRVAAETDAARGTSAEHATACLVSAAAADVAAREAWVGWVEGGV